MNRDLAFPEPIRATEADLPAPVSEALRHPGAAELGTVEVAGTTWAMRSWGDPAAPPMLLAHGVTSYSASFWRIGPALAASGRRVVAVDLPGHGQTGGWTGRHRHAQTAADLAGFIRAAGLDSPGLVCLGHSWGGVVVANLPLADVRPALMILLDPPAQTAEELEPMTRDPSELPYDSVEAAMQVVRAANPTWSDGDVRAKAEGQCAYDVAAVRQVLLDNRTWDAGLGALSDPRAVDVPVWLIRGEDATGGLVPEAFLPRLAARIGADHVLTIAGGSHSPHRVFPEATLVATLRALDSTGRARGR